jgi:hypothetical protein
MSAHSASYHSHFGDTQNDRDKGARVCDHRHCISLAESACDSCGNQFCGAHGDVDNGPDDPGVCWDCIQERIDEARAALNAPKHCKVIYMEEELCLPNRDAIGCTPIYTEADLCSPW